MFEFVTLNSQKVMVRPLTPKARDWAITHAFGLLEAAGVGLIKMSEAQALIVLLQGEGFETRNGN
jgi:hypothetical protein